MKPTVTFLVLLLAISAPLYAHQNATGIVKERMDGMKSLSRAMKTLLAETQSPNPDPATIKEVAKTLQTHAGTAMTDRFPEGSLDHPTEAIPAIWENWQRFEFLAQQLDLQAKGLALAAGNPNTGKTVAPRDNRMLMDFASMGPDEVFSLIGHNCKACHTEFRVKKK